VHLNQQHGIRSQIQALPAEIRQREERIGKLTATLQGAMPMRATSFR